MLGEPFEVVTLTRSVADLSRRVVARLGLADPSPALEAGLAVRVVIPALLEPSEALAEMATRHRGCVHPAPPKPAITDLVEVS